MRNKDSNLEKEAMKVLDNVKLMGKDFYEGSEHLAYGMEKGLFTQDEIDANQRVFESKR